MALEVFDWNQIEQAKSLGTGRIELADLEPFEGVDRSIKLSHTKHGEQGEIRVRLLFTPEIIAKTRKNTSTFSTAGRAMTQISAIPLGAGKGVFHGVGKVGHGVGKVGSKVSGVFGFDHSSRSSDEETVPIVNAEDPPAGQVSATLGTKDSGNGVKFPMSDGDGGVAPEPGTLRVTVLNAKDLSSPDGDPPKPYVVVRVGEKEYKTKHSGKTVTPEW